VAGHLVRVEARLLGSPLHHLGGVDRVEAPPCQLADRLGPVPADSARGLGRALPLLQPGAEALLKQVRDAL
jgi:hypothetical protein